jgi:hypothetical protein
MAVDEPHRSIADSSSNLEMSLDDGHAMAAEDNAVAGKFTVDQA